MSWSIAWVNYLNIWYLTLELNETSKVYDKYLGSITFCRFGSMDFSEPFKEEEEEEDIEN